MNNIGLGSNLLGLLMGGLNGADRTGQAHGLGRGLGRGRHQTLQANLGGSGELPVHPMMLLCLVCLELFSQYLPSQPPVDDSGNIDDSGSTDDTGSTDNTDSTDDTDGTDDAGSDDTQNSNGDTHDYCPPPPPPPAEKNRGSAGLFGDPTIAVFTPQLDQAVRDTLNFDSGMEAGQTYNLLNDPDSDLSLNVNANSVNPQSPEDSVGVEDIDLTSGGNRIRMMNNGDITLQRSNSDAIEILGNINDEGTVGTVTLDNGATLSTGAASGDSERFIFKDGQYTVTAALRSPHPDANNYYDLNFEETTEDAADNASGDTFGTGLPNGPLSVADLLALEQDSPLVKQILGVA